MNLQVQGGKHDTVETKDIDKSAPVLFKKLSEFFFIINSWGELFGNATTFQVTDQEGQNKFEKIEVGDLVKIKIPGPKSKVGHGYDWVQIVEISEDMNSALASLMISVKPCSRSGDSNRIAHFFTSDSINYFLITYSDYQITAEVHERNEIPNYKNLTLQDKIRNVLVANGGILGFGKIHWEVWAKNFLSINSVK